MNDLYDIITALRQRNHLSVRMLAMRADIPPTTLASMMTRRPSTMDKSFLIQIAKALGVKWVMLLNKPDSYADECELEDRISVEMTQEDIEAVQRNLIEPFTTVARFGVREQRFSDYIADTCRRRRSEESDFKQSFAFVLDKLNDDGLLEAMRRVLEIAP